MPSGFNFRRFLRADPSADPLERLAEIGRTEDPPAQFSGTTTRDGVAGVSPVAVVKKSKKRGPPDPRNFDVWKRGQSNSIAGLFDRVF